MRYIRTFQPEKGGCFVLMPFGGTAAEQELNWNDIYDEVIVNVVQRVGMTPSKLSDMYSTGSMMEQNWQSIQKAELVIANLCGRDPNVLYSLALAHVIGKPIILVAMDEKEVPVDLREYFVIKYKQNEQNASFKFSIDLEKAIIQARSQPAAAEMELRPIWGSDGAGPEVEAKVLSVAEAVAVVEHGDKQGILNAENYSWSRRNFKLTSVLEVGKAVKGHFFNGPNKELKFSCIDEKNNPWLILEKNFPKNEEKPGIVVGVIAAGIFIRLDKAHRIDSLIHAENLPKGTSFQVGDEIIFKTISIDTKNRVSNLAFVRKLVSQDPYAIGKQVTGKIIRANYDKGYVLIEYEEGIRPGGLDKGHMSPKLLQQFNQGEVAIGLEIKVEVIVRNKEENKVWFKELI